MSKNLKEDTASDIQYLLYKTQVRELERLRKSLTNDDAHAGAVKAIDRRIKVLDKGAIASEHEALW